MITRVFRSKRKRIPWRNQSKPQAPREQFLQKRLAF
jgi:hypothetical protein